MATATKAARILLGIFLLLWILLADSPYQKGGTGWQHSLAFPVLLYPIAVLMALGHHQFRMLERLLVALLSGTLVLIVVSLFLTPFVVQLLYGHKTWYLWETGHRLLINTFYYGTATALLAFLIPFYFKLRTLQPLPQKSGRRKES